MITCTIIKFIYLKKNIELHVRRSHTFLCDIKRKMPYPIISFVFLFLIIIPEMACVSAIIVDGFILFTDSECTCMVPFVLRV